MKDPKPSDIKACPCCKSPIEESHVLVAKGRVYDRHCVLCPGCGLNTGWDNASREEALRKWNRREKKYAKPVKIEVGERSEPRDKDIDDTSMEAS